MTSFEVIEARPWHCGQMSRIIRTEQRAAVVRMGVSVHAQIRSVFDASAFRRAWMIDGKLAGLGGITGTMASVRGVVWLALSLDSLRYPVAIVKEARRQIAEITTMVRTIETTVFDEDLDSLRFALFMGFEIAGEPIAFGTKDRLIPMLYASERSRT